MSNFNILEALKNYYTKYPEEHEFVKKTISFLEEKENCFDRSNLRGHVVGGALLLNPDEDKVLLTRHKILNKWLHLGGHADGDTNTWRVAFREAREESGINDIEFVHQNIFDVDVHIIPENEKKNEPAHRHYDIRFLLKANTEEFKISDESYELRWFNAHELYDMIQNGEIEESQHRMFYKFINRNKVQQYNQKSYNPKMF